MITGNTLLSWGWTTGPAFGQALSRAKALDAAGVSHADIQQQLESLRPVPVIRQPLRSVTEAAPLQYALIAETEEEKTNYASVTQLMQGMMRIPVVTKGAIMPDACPAGGAVAAITVGGAIAVQDAIIPAAHSADICCSMYCTFFLMPKREAKDLMQDLRHSTRFGAGGRARSSWVPHPVLKEAVWDNPFLKGLEEYAAKHMGDQGDGNHFAYIGSLVVTQELITALAASGHELHLTPHLGETLLALVTHHGSRGLGAQVYKRGQTLAVSHTDKVAVGVPPSAAWLDATSHEGQQYWDALQYVSRWTRANHEVIHESFTKQTKLLPISSFGNEHNFVWKRSDGLYYHGKGATPAWNDAQGRPLLGLIPLNMASPILLVLGKSNESFLGFAPHGAGRNLSRTQTLNKFRRPDGTLDEAAVAKEITDSTKGLAIEWWFNKPDLTETPIGYKNAQQVIEQITSFGLADVVATIQPLGCIMAGDAGPAPWLKRKDVLSPKEVRQIGHRAERRKVHQALDAGLDPDSVDLAPKTFDPV
jgi:RNA-splicing ligase RtcB